MEFAQLTPGRGFNPTQSFLYYGQRLITIPSWRRFIVERLRTHIGARAGMVPSAQALTVKEEGTLCSLRESGYAPLQVLLSAAQVADIHAFLSKKSLKGRQVELPRFTIDNIPEDVRMADYDLRDIIDCPHILELANSPSLLRLARHYIGCKPTISALGLRWSFPRSSVGDVQNFHRDSDDWRFFKVLVYLTDVGTESGPHVYVRGTHLTKASLRLRFYSDEEVRQTYGSDRIVVVTGASGLGFAVDTSGIHKGMVPRDAPRLLLQIQYSLLPSYAYRYEPQLYSGPLKLDSYINRLILR